jgi:nucleotide-binding universal stress UspA family protein
VASPVSEITAVEHLTAIGDPRLVLGDLTTADIMVTGPTGRGLLKSLRIGSTTAWLLQDPPCPLVIARSAAPAERIVVCVDGSVHARRAVDVLAGLPWVAGAEAVVLAVSDGTQGLAVGTEHAEASLQAAGTSVKTVTGKGKPSRAILAQIEEHGATLVVLGTRGHTQLRHLLVGSTASAVVQSAPCSVLVARAPDA